MSVKKIETVKKSRKDQGKCGKCGEALPAGSGYLCWYPYFRSNTKMVRCLKPECFPRPSERESSLAATVLAAQESFHDNVGDLDSPDEIEAAVQEVADAVGETRDEYQGALDNWEHGNEQLQEKVDHYEGQQSEIDGWSWDGNTDYALCEEHEGREDEVGEEAIQACEACQSNREEWLEECREAAREVVDAVETL